MLQIFCEQWNEVIDICNGRHGPHSPDNAVMRQTRLLDTLVWFSRWKELHDERVRAKLATEYNFFANETRFCINDARGRARSCLRGDGDGCRVCG